MQQPPSSFLDSPHPESKRESAIKEDDAITQQFHQQANKQEGGMTNDDWKIYMPIMTDF